MGAVITEKMMRVSKMSFILQSVFSVSLISLVVVYPLWYRKGESEAMTVKILNPTESPVALCWLSSYARENELIENSPDGCYRIGQGEKNTFTLNTFEGHRFILLPWDKKAYADENFATLPTIFVYMKPGLTFYEVEFKSTIESLRDIDSLTDFWQQLLRHRHHFMIFLVSLYILNMQFINYTSYQTRKPAGKHRRVDGISEVNTLISRQSLKSFAVISMILNHISYILFDEKSLWRFIGTIPADLIGSSQIFWFLVGLHHASSHTTAVRSNSVVILVSFLLLEHFCRLPKPLTYETLFTVVVCRTLLSLDIFQYDKELKLVSFSRYPIWLHAILCSLIIAANDIFNANGLRLFQCVGILYAVAGRLFLCGRSTAPLSSRAAQFVWLLAASGFQIKCIWANKVSYLEIYSIQSVVTFFCFLGALFQFYIFAFPVKNSLWVPSKSAVMLSRYSLEIYVGHLVLLWLFNESKLIK